MPSGVYVAQVTGGSAAEQAGEGQVHGVCANQMIQSPPGRYVQHGLEMCIRDRVVSRCDISLRVEHLRHILVEVHAIACLLYTSNINRRRRSARNAHPRAYKGRRVLY